MAPGKVRCLLASIGGDISAPGACQIESAYAIVNRRVAQAGMQKASPHDLRRSFITYLLDCDVDIGTVADMAGHADVNTTRIYDRRQKKRNKKAAEKIKF